MYAKRHRAQYTHNVPDINVQFTKAVAQCINCAWDCLLNVSLMKCKLRFKKRFEMVKTVTHGAVKTRH